MAGKSFAAVLLFGLSALLGACQSGERPRALPFAAAARAQVPDQGTIRFWGDEAPPALAAYVDDQFRQIRASGCRTCGRQAQFLAISGGGGDGAFAAGLLKGWSERGDRPVFEVVTGVSTGSLAAPFAFLGPNYDRDLEAVYTTLGDNDIFRDKGVVGLLSDSLYDTAPLRAAIERYVSEEFLDAIAAEHRKGRRLLVQTTNLDAQRPVIWDMGAIASGSKVGRHKLFVDVLLASAAIPAVFPPVRIEVESDGKRFDELHVDGGVTSQIFFAPPGLDLNAAARRVFGNRRDMILYVIRNGKLQPEYKPSIQSVAGLATRSISTLVKYQSLANITTLSEGARRAKARMAYAAIPESFSELPASEFDRTYMGKLFVLGESLGRAGTAWRTTPPASPILALR